MSDDGRGVAGGLLARVSDHCYPESFFERGGLVSFGVELPQARGVGQEGEPGLAAAVFAAVVAVFRSLVTTTKGLGRGGEGRLGLFREIERVGGRQGVVLVEDRGLEARGGEGAPVEAGDVGDGEVREQERRGGGGLFFFFSS